MNENNILNEYYFWVDQLPIEEENKFFYKSAECLTEYIVVMNTNKDNGSNDV